MFKSYTFNFPFALCGIKAIRVEQSARDKWYVECLDEHGRNRVPVRALPDKESADKMARFHFDRLTSEHVNTNTYEPR